MKLLAFAGLLLLLSGCATIGSAPDESGGMTSAVTMTLHDDGATRVVVAADTAFTYGGIILQPAVTGELLRRVDSLKQQAVVVSGYTDNIGAAAYNKTLSQQRAQSVASALELEGFAAANITVHGNGEADPLASNETAAGRRVNRRVELLFTPTH